MVRDKATGKPRGFAFICYEDQRSTILAVDNLNGIKVSICCIFLYWICSPFTALFSLSWERDNLVHVHLGRNKSNLY